MSWVKNILLALPFVPVVFAEAQIRTIWQIGKFDRSPLEFSSPARDSVTFQIGKSDWRTDWPGSQGVRR